jgi:hypothetical protein
MTECATHLRDQAEKCRLHAKYIGDDQTKEALRTLAAEYVARAEEIESKK